MRKATAYRFKSDFNLEAIHGKVEAKTGWPWYQRVNDTYGEYLMTRIPEKDYARLRIFPQVKGHFILDAVCESESSFDYQWSMLQNTIQHTVLLAVDASEIAEVDTFD